MWWCWLGWAFAGSATLHVGVLRQAGTVHEVAADGASGLCAAGPSRITCPADGPVRFRWAGSPEFELVGQAEVAPGEVGTAFVLATEASRARELDLLAGAVDRDLVAALYAPAPGVQAPAPSLSMIHELERLARHPDPDVRRAVVDAMVPLWRHTASDPFPADAPEVLEPGLITLLATDPEVKVRRRLASRLRELRAPSVAQHAEAISAYGRLLADGRTPVQKAALGSLKVAVAEGDVAGESAWTAALERVQQPGPPGRAAANTLAFLARSLEPGPNVDPGEALHQVMAFHPERGWNVWYAWRDHLPVDVARLDALLRDTVGLHRGLLRHLAVSAPDDLAAALRRWEPHPPHSDRYAIALSWLVDVRHPALQALADEAAPPR